MSCLFSASSTSFPRLSFVSLLILIQGVFVFSTVSFPFATAISTVASSPSSRSTVPGLSNSRFSHTSSQSVFPSHRTLCSSSDVITTRSQRSAARNTTTSTEVVHPRVLDSCHPRRRPAPPSTPLIQQWPAETRQTAAPVHRLLHRCNRSCANRRSMTWNTFHITSSLLATPPRTKVE